MISLVVNSYHGIFLSGWYATNLSHRHQLTGWISETVGLFREKKSLEFSFWIYFLNSSNHDHGRHHHHHHHHLVDVFHWRLEVQGHKSWKSWKSQWMRKDAPDAPWNNRLFGLFGPIFRHKRRCFPGLSDGITSTTCLSCRIRPLWKGPYLNKGCFFFGGGGP